MNRPLAAGLGLLLVLAFVAAFSGSLAPNERGYSKSVIAEEVEGKTVYYFAPEPPGRHFVMGSDIWGYDLFSEMLHGLRWTLGIVTVTALARCILAAGYALFSGARGGRGRERRGFSPLAAIPGFILAAFALYPITINSGLPPLVLFAAQSAVLVVVELPALAAGFATRAAQLRARPYVESARVAGADGAWIARFHVLPFLVVDFIEALPVQALSVAAMVGKLGVVRIFIGGTNLTFEPLIFQPAKGELLGLLGYHYFEALKYPWLFFSPFAGWLLVLLAIGLLAAGTKKAYAKARRLERA